MNAIDCSYDFLTDEEAQCLRESGSPVFIQCLLALTMQGPIQPSARLNNLRVALRNGLQVGGYILVGGRRAGVEYVRLGREGIPDDVWAALKFVAVDVETPGVRVEEILVALQEVQRLGKKTLLYTNYNSWVNHVVPGNSTRLSSQGYLLWNAYWDGAPDVDFSRLPFGGWRTDQVAIEQWQGDTLLCEQSVDRNIIVRPELINLTGGEEHMPTQEYNTLKGLVDELRQVVDKNAMRSAAGNFDLAAAIERIRKGEAKAPIWPLGDVPLTQVYHRAFHTKKMVEDLIPVVNEARGAIAQHLQVHNTSGGVIDTVSGAHLIAIADLLDKLEAELRRVV